MKRNRFIAARTFSLALLLALGVACKDDAGKKDEKAQSKAMTGQVEKPDVLKMPPLLIQAKPLEEPKDKLSRQLIENWEMIYRGKLDKLNGNNETGYSAKYLIETAKSLQALEEGWKRSGEFRHQRELIFAHLGIPLELVDNAFNESNWTYRIKSYAKAGGMDQFMPRTAAEYGLDSLSQFIDERSDPLLSSEAAAQFFAKVAKPYQDNKDQWLLALMAYHQGATGLKRYIEKCGDADFSKILAKLQEEYLELLPEVKKAYQTMKTVEWEYNKKEKEINKQKAEKHQQLSKAKSKQKKGLIQETKKLDKSLSKALSQFRKAESRHKVLERKKNSLLEKMNYVPKFFGIKRAIYGKDGLAENVQPNPEIEFDSVQIDYPDNEYVVTVQPRQSLGSIANQYGVRVADLKRWNNLSSDTIHPNQALRIVVVKSPITIDELTRKLNLTQEQIFGINHAFHLPSAEKLDRNTIILPEEYNLRLPKEYGGEFVGAFSDRLTDGENTPVALFRAEDSNQIIPLIATQTAESLKKTATDQAYAALLQQIEAGKLIDKEKIAQLDALHRNYERELDEGLHKKDYVRAQQASIRGLITDIEEEIAAQEAVGGELTDMGEFITFAIQTYQQTDKTDISALGRVANAFIEALKRVDEEEDKQTCVENLALIQDDLSKIVNGGIHKIEGENYGFKKQPIPQELLDTIINAYGKAQALEAYTEKSLASEEALRVLIGMLRIWNQDAQEQALKRPEVKPVMTEKPKPSSKQAAQPGLERKVLYGWTESEVAQNYGITVKQLRDANPNLKDGLQAREKIIIPVNFKQYKVQPGDRIITIANKFKTTPNTLYNTNPGLWHIRNNLQAGYPIDIVIHEDKNSMKK